MPQVSYVAPSPLDLNSMDLGKLKTRSTISGASTTPDAAQLDGAQKENKTVIVSDLPPTPSQRPRKGGGFTPTSHLKSVGKPRRRRIAGDVHPSAPHNTPCEDAKNISLHKYAVKCNLSTVALDKSKSWKESTTRTLVKPTGRVSLLSGGARRVQTKER